MDIQVGDYVLDDLTGNMSTVEEIQAYPGEGWKNVIVILKDKTYLDGQRYAWELTKE